MAYYTIIESDAMSTPISRISAFKPPRVVMLYFLVDVGLCVAYVMNYLFEQPSQMLTKVLDLNAETSLGNWYSSIQFFSIFVLFSIFVFHKVGERKKLLLLIPLPLMFLFMSIDEAVQIHEWLGKKSDVLLSSGSRIGTAVEKTGIWMFVVGLPFLAIFLLWINSIKSTIAEQAASIKKLVLGMIVLLSGALVIEFFSNFVDGSLLVAQIAAEESLELIGATIILWSAYDMASGLGAQFNLRFEHTVG